MWEDKHHLLSVTQNDKQELFGSEILFVNYFKVGATSH